MTLGVLAPRAGRSPIGADLIREAGAGMALSRIAEKRIPVFGPESREIKGL